MQDPNPLTQKLISEYRDWYETLQPKEGEAKIKVDEVVSKVASFYEKVRGVIDWREEHLLRKTAVERTLKRRLFLKKSGEEIAEPLVQELIRGGHFPNDAIPEKKIAEIQKVINKYIFIIENAPIKIQLNDWLLGIAACEVEETLAPPLKEKALMDYMRELMATSIEVKEKISEEEENVQIDIAIQQALFKLDAPVISYHLLEKWFPQWPDLPQEKLSEITQNIRALYNKIENALKHPLAEKFYNICERYDTPYLILGDIITQGPPRTLLDDFKNPETLEGKVREAYNGRLKKVKARMGRAAFYSTLSIFITKMLVAFAIEIPFDKYITHEFSYFTSGLNILIPPLLMFFLVLSIRPPSKNNAELVVMEVMKIVYQKERKGIYEIKLASPRGFILNAIIVLIYLLSFVGSFGLIIWGLKKLNFSLLSIIIFLVFSSLISFAGVKIRQRAKELVVEKEKEGFLRTFFDLFSLPIIQVGKWLSNQWTKYNAVAVLFNSLLDMPFQVFMEFLEQWRLFLKEKKEKIH